MDLSNSATDTAFLKKNLAPFDSLIYAVRASALRACRLLYMSDEDSSMRSFERGAPPTSLARSVKNSFASHVVMAFTSTVFLRAINAAIVESNSGGILTV